MCACVYAPHLFKLTATILSNSFVVVYLVVLLEVRFRASSVESIDRVRARIFSLCLQSNIHNYLISIILSFILNFCLADVYWVHMCIPSSVPSDLRISQPFIRWLLALKDFSSLPSTNGNYKTAVIDRILQWGKYSIYLHCPVWQQLVTYSCWVCEIQVVQLRNQNLNFV